MKNPMTPEEQCEAIMDNDAGYDIELRPIGSTSEYWSPRIHGAGKPLNFEDFEYRRKPRTSEDILKMAVIWWLGDGRQKFIGAPAWVFEAREIIEPVPEVKNPWQPITKGEWPECKPGDEIIVQWEDGTTAMYIADWIPWSVTDATGWRYEEDE